MTMLARGSGPRRIRVAGAALCLVVFVSALGCGGRAAMSITPKMAAQLRARTGAVLVAVPSRILWEEEGSDRRVHGVVPLGDVAATLREAWAGAIQRRLEGRGFKMVEPPAAVGNGAWLVTISATDFAADLRHTILVEARSRGARLPANGGGTRFLTRPLVLGPGDPRGVKIDRPARYDLAGLSRVFCDWAVVVDVVEWILIRQPDGSPRPGYAVVQWAVLDLAEYRVRSFVRLEKAANDHSDWLLGPRVGGLDLAAMRQGRLEAVVSAFEPVGERLADVVERQLGLITEKQFRQRESLWARGGGAPGREAAAPVF